MYPKHSSESSVLAMSVDEAFVYAITEAAVGLDGQRIPIKQVAGLSNIPLSRLYEIAGGRAKPWANEIAPIVRATRCPAPADVLERDINRIGVMLPVVTADGDPVIDRAAKALKEFGEFMAKLAQAALDHRYTKDEAREVRIEAEQAIAVVLEAVQQVEAAAGLTALAKLGLVR